MSETYNTYRNLLLLMMYSKRHMHEIMEKRQMTPVQGMLLTVIDDSRGTSMQQIAQILGCDASNVTGLVDRLDTQELIERTVDPNDRRVKVIRLSQKGCKCRDEMLKSLASAEAADLQKLTPDERKSLNSIILKLTENVRNPGNRQ